MTSRNVTKVALAALVAAVAAGCGGGSDGGGSVDAVSSGAVRGFGSVQVNGVQWKVAGATLRLEDSVQSLANEDSIKTFVPEGAVVTVKGQRDSNGTTGTATEIEFRSIIEGPIVAGSIDENGFRITGLDIVVDAQTTIFNAGGGQITFDQVPASARAEVSGLPEGATALHATMIRLKNPQAEYEARGYVVPAASASFGLSLESGGAAYLNVTGALPAGAGNGSIVEVRGTSYNEANNTLVATTVELEDRLVGNRNAEAEVEGIVTQYAGGDTFVVNGQTVQVTSSTRFTGAADPGNPRADLANGVKVEAEGQLDANGTLVARKIQFKDAVRIQAVAATGTGGVTMLGQNVRAVAGRTQFEDGSSLQAGQFLQIRGYQMANGAIFAQRVRAGGSSGDRPFLQGVVTAKNPTTSLSLLGITVSTAGAEFRDLNDAAMNATTFYNAVTPGRTLVKIRWRNPGDTTSSPVDEVEIEDD